MDSLRTDSQDMGIPLLMAVIHLDMVSLLLDMGILKDLQ